MGKHDSLVPQQKNLRRKRSNQRSDFFFYVYFPGIKLAWCWMFDSRSTNFSMSLKLHTIFVYTFLTSITFEENDSRKTYCGLKLNSWRATALKSLAPTSSNANLLGSSKWSWGRFHKTSLPNKPVILTYFEPNQLTICQTTWLFHLAYLVNLFYETGPRRPWLVGWGVFD